MEAVVYSMFGIVALLAGGVFVLGWLVPFIMGIVRRRRKQSGMAFIVIGGVWGALALCFVGLCAYMYFSTLQDYSFSAKAETFDPAGYEGPKGRIVLPYDGEVSLVVSLLDDDRRWRLSGKEGEVLAPAGILKVEEFEASATDDQGKKWTATRHLWWGAGRELYVREDASTRLDMGPPLVASATAQHVSADRASFDVEITGTEGQSYSLNYPGGAPGFEVLSQSGEVLWTGKLEAG